METYQAIYLQGDIGYMLHLRKWFGKDPYRVDILQIFKKLFKVKRQQASDNKMTKINMET